MLSGSAHVPACADDADAGSPSVQESCCQGQHTYLHAQMMLTQLARLPRGARFGRLSQELELHAAKLYGQIAWQMHFWWADGPLPA